MSPLRRVVVAAGALVLLGLVLHPAVPEARGARRFVHRHSPRAKLTEDTDPPEVTVGERLFLETRFAQFFAAHDRGDVNRPLASGDPLMDSTLTTGAPLPGAFAGKSMNCRTCHFVDDVAGVPGGSIRTYADFARKSPMPERDDRRLETPRNSPAMVNAFLPRERGLLLHFDGEFASTEDLVVGTLAGRNFGWLPSEAGAAINNLAHVIREDDGSGDLGAQYLNLPYRVLLTGTDPGLPPELHLPAAFRVDVAQATDRQLLDAVARLIAAYNESLVFSQDEDGLYNGSPYDAFLAKNELPRGPDAGESETAYTARLASLVAALGAPRFVNAADGAFELHDQAFAFGRKELDGLTLFLARGGPGASHAGNCVACHPAPSFTDFGLHNTGASQEEYDAANGTGAFEALHVPDFAERSAHPELLPPSEAHPGALGTFRARAAAERPGQADLGVWNVFANPDLPRPQATIARTLDAVGQPAAQVLPRTIALFKTAGLRDLGQSAPYLHAGRKDTLEDVLRFYVTFAQKARLGRVRNGDPELARIFIAEDDVAPLAAFLRSLNEDYQ